jgi:putative hydrolase of the HAD superfamily
MSRERPVCFIDFDDTLVDYRREEQRAVTAVAAAVVAHRLLDEPAAFVGHYRQVTADLYAERSTDGRVDVLTYCRKLRIGKALALSGVDASADFVAELIACYWETRLQSLAVLPAASELLAALSRDWQLVLATDGDGFYQDLRVTRSGLRPWFAEILISGAIGCSKYNLARFLDCCTLSTTHRDLFISDSPRPDLEQSLSLGLRCIWFNRTAPAHAHPALPVPQARTYEDLLKQADAILLKDHARC